MEQIDKSPLEQQICVSMEESIEISRELLILTRQIHKYMRFARISSIIQAFVIIAPIVISLFYIPTLLKGISELTGSLPLQMMQQQGNGTEAVPANYDLNSLIKQYQQSQQQR